jgi:hypothetical protein
MQSISLINIFEYMIHRFFFHSFLFDQKHDRTLQGNLDRKLSART